MTPVILLYDKRIIPKNEALTRFKDAGLLKRNMQVKIASIDTLSSRLPAVKLATDAKPEAVDKWSQTAFNRINMLVFIPSSMKDTEFQVRSLLNKWATKYSSRFNLSKGNHRIFHCLSRSRLFGGLGYKLIHYQI